MAHIHQLPRTSIFVAIQIHDAPTTSQLPTEWQTLLPMLQFLQLYESEIILHGETRLLVNEVAADPGSSVPEVQASHGGERQEPGVWIVAPGSGEALLSSVTFGQMGATISPATAVAPSAVALRRAGKGEHLGHSQEGPFTLALTLALHSWQLRSKSRYIIHIWK